MHKNKWALILFLFCYNDIGPIIAAEGAKGICSSEPSFWFLFCSNVILPTNTYDFPIDFLQQMED